MKRAALLLRCSTNIQDYNRQKLELEKVANRFKLKVAKVFGEHVTGKDDIRKGNRKSVDELINACENDEIDVVLISEVSRLTRNFLYGVTLVDKFNRDYSIPIYFRDKRKWTIDVETGEVNLEFEKELRKAFEQAEEELASIRFRMASGKRDSAGLGQWFAGFPPFGYTRQKNGYLVKNEYAPIVKEMFDKYLEEGQALITTTRYIYGKYPDIKKLKSIGNTKFILNNRAYTGRAEAGEFAEEAIIVEEVAAPKRVNHFIEANTQEVTLQHLQQDCIIPSFASMEETISHQSFIGAVVDAAKDYFHGEQFDMPEIRISHPINGRIPSALGKKASELTDEEKTLFYQRMCFCFEIPSIVHDEYGNRLALSIGGVRAYNEINLYSKKSVERFKIFIGFRNRVCSNLMLTTDGLQDKVEVLSVQELYAAALNLFHAYNPSKDLHLLRTLGQMSISTSEFCQIIGRMRLYQALTPNQQKRLPRLLLGDSQINAACRAFVSDVNFKSTGDSITGWQLLNLLNGSVKSSYIDNFLERNLNCTEFVQGIQRAKLGDSEYAWFLG